MAVVTRYVNTASAAGGDGTTNGTAGATRAYSTVAEWESAEETNLVTATDTHIVYCDGTTADTSAPTISGWTSNATYFVTISGNLTSGTGYNDTGVFSTSFYRLQSTAGLDPLVIKQGYVVVENLQIYNISGGRRGIEIGASGDGSTLRNLIIRHYNADDGVKLRALTMYNCTVEGNGVGSSGIRVLSASSKIYNCTVQNCIDGIDGGSKTGAVIKNCAIFNNTTDIANATGLTIDYNASDDVVGTNTQDMSSGGTESDGWNSAVTDYTTGDFTPVSSGVLIGNGVGNSTDGDVPTTDILGVTRSTTAPTIGAFEYVAVVSPSSFKPQVLFL